MVHWFQDQSAYVSHSVVMMTVKRTGNGFSYTMQYVYFSQFLFINLFKSVLVNTYHIRMLNKWHDYYTVVPWLVIIKGHSKMCCFILKKDIDCALNYGFHTTDPHFLVTVTSNNNGGVRNVSGVTTICIIQCDTSPLHRVDMVVYCGPWNVGPILFNGSAKLLAIGRNWNTLSYAPIHSITVMLDGWHVWWVCRPCKNWEVFSFQELCTDPHNILSCTLSCYNMRSWWWVNGTTVGLRISSQYLCAFKLPSIKLTCVRCP